MPEIVMLLSNSFKPDPRVLKEAESLQKSGFRVTILCWDRTAELLPEESLASGVKVIRIQNISSGYGIGIRQLFRLPFFWNAVQNLLKDIQPSIIHCHDFDTLPAGLWFGKIHHIPVIYDAHEYYAELVKPRLNGIMGRMLFRLIRWLELVGASLSNAVVTVDETLASIYQNRNRRVVVLGHYPEKAMAAKHNPVFTRPNLTMIYAGRLSVDRGILIYADIVHRLHEINIPARLVIAGTFTPASEKVIFYDYAKNIRDCVIDLGWIPYNRMPEAFYEADIGLAVLLPEPRYIAATPVKLFEYMACGLPVIASNFLAIAKIVTDADCGILVDPAGDITLIVQAIEYWWKNQFVPRSFGENGRQAILSKYNWEIRINHLVQLYQDLL